MSFGVAVSAEMAPPHDMPAVGIVTTDATTTSRSSASFNHSTVLGLTKAVVVFVHWRNTLQTILSVTYGGQPLVPLSGAVTTTGSTGKGVKAYILTGGIPPGANTVAVTWSGAVAASAVIAANLSKVNPQKPLEAYGAASGNSAAPGLTLEGTRPNALMLAAACGAWGHDPGDPDPGITELYDGKTGTTTGDDIWYWAGSAPIAVPGTGSVSCDSGTSDTWAMSGVVLNGAP